MGYKRRSGWKKKPGRHLRKKQIQEKKKTDQKRKGLATNSGSDEVEPDSLLIVEAEQNQVVDLVKNISGRRIVDLGYFLQQLRILSEHDDKNIFNCSFSNLILVKIKQHGLRWELTFVCKMCQFKKTISTDDPSDESTMDLNTAATHGIMSIGSGFAHLQQISSNLNMPCMNRKLYKKSQDKVCAFWLEVGIEEMANAAEIEKNEALKRNEVDNKGVPIITVIADGCYGKRSFRNNFQSLYGTAFIVGARTGKILFMSVKNKFCYICALRESQGKEANSSDHTCYKNWDSKMSASSMESAIIVEGFGMSEEMYGLKYNKLIGDGDSSVHKRLIEAHPYDNFEVQKIECKNHLLRNYAKKLREYTKKTGTPVSLRKALLNNIMKMRNAVTKASEHHRDQDCDDETKVNNLRRDIVNSIYHIFGDHSKCQSYYCSGSKPNETNIIKDFQTSGMMKKLQGIIWDLAKHSRSLIHNVDSNLVEQAFSLVAKLVGGKRTNVAHTYKARCSAAVISHNTGGKLHYTVHKNIFKSSPGKYAKIGEFLKVRKVALARARRQAVRNRNEPVISYKRRKTQRYSAGCSSQIDYGADAHQAPMSDVDLENAKT
ncbi:hypothetical protein B566_EDAN018090, partial [Ephemera danica]